MKAEETDFDRFLSFISSTDFNWRIDFMDAKLPFEKNKTQMSSQNLYKFLVKEGNGIILDDTIHIKTAIIIRVNAHDNGYEILHAFTENGLYIGSIQIRVDYDRD